METKIMQVFYDNAGFPYKDSELTIHYPIVGSEFVGSNNATEIRFYVSNVSNTASWLADIKLPNDPNPIWRVLTPHSDNGVVYQSLQLDNQITKIKGHVLIGLKGFESSDIEIEDGEITINGTPTIVATGIINIAMNYTPFSYHIEPFTPSDLELLMSLIAQKLNVANGIIVIADLDEDTSSYENGQIFFNLDNGNMYKKTGASTYELVIIDFESGILVNSKTLTADDSGVIATREWVLQLGFENILLPTFAFIKNGVTNLNDKWDNRYTVVNTTIGGYQAKVVKFNGAIMSLDQASEYCEFMCGNKFVPTYNYSKPKNSYWVMTTDSTIWKPQYDDTNGMVLYAMGRVGGGDVESVNGKTGAVVLKASDILANNLSSIQANLERIDGIIDGSDPSDIAFTDKQNTFTQEQTFSGNIQTPVISLPSGNIAIRTNYGLVLIKGALVPEGAFNLGNTTGHWNIGYINKLVGTDNQEVEVQKQTLVFGLTDGTFETYDIVGKKR